MIFLRHFIGSLCMLFVLVVHGRPAGYRLVEVSHYDMGCPPVNSYFHYLFSNNNNTSHHYQFINDDSEEFRIQIQSYGDCRFGSSTNMFSCPAFTFDNIFYSSLLGADYWVRVVPLWDNTISGRVLYRGQPVQGADIRVHRDNGFWLEQMGNEICSSGDDGYYSFNELPAGAYWVSCSFVGSDSYFFARPYTGGVVQVSGVVSNIDFSVDGDYTFSGRLFGHWDVPATNVYCEVFRRSVDKSFSEMYIPPGYTLSDVMNPSIYVPGFIPAYQLPDGAWWWAVTPTDYLCTDSNGYFNISGLESGWYIFRFFGGNLLEDFEYEVYISSDSEYLKHVPLNGVYFDVPPYGKIVITQFDLFKGGSTSYANIWIRDNYKAQRKWHIMFSSNLVDWVENYNINGSINVGIPMTKSVRVQRAIPAAYKDRLFVKIIMNDL